MLGQKSTSVQYAEQINLSNDGEREPDADDEPSLGSFDRMVDQSKSRKLREGIVTLAQCAQ